MTLSKISSFSAVKKNVEYFLFWVFFCFFFEIEKYFLFWVDEREKKIFCFESEKDFLFWVDESVLMRGASNIAEPEGPHIAEEGL